MNTVPSSIGRLNTYSTLVNNTVGPESPHTNESQIKFPLESRAIRTSISGSEIYRFLSESLISLKLPYLCLATSIFWLFRHVRTNIQTFCISSFHVNCTRSIFFFIFSLFPKHFTEMSCLMTVFKFNWLRAFSQIKAIWESLSNSNHWFLFLLSQENTCAWAFWIMAGKHD